MAIVVTALGTAQNKTDRAKLNLTGGVVVGDLFIMCVASDQAPSLPQIWYNIGMSESGIEDVKANNSGNVVLTINRILTTRAQAWDGTYPYIIAGYAAVANAIAVYKVTGLATTTPLDKIKTAVNTGTTPSSTDTVATTQADELLIGGIGTEGPDGDTPGTWNGDTTQNNQRLGTTGASGASNITVAAATKIVSATGTYSADKTGITSRDWAAAIATYKALVGGAAWKKLAFTSEPPTPNAWNQLKLDAGTGWKKLLLEGD